MRRPISQKAAVLMAVAAAMPVTATVAHADTSSIAAKEIARRQGLVAESHMKIRMDRSGYFAANIDPA